MFLQENVVAQLVHLNVFDLASHEVAGLSEQV